MVRNFTAELSEKKNIAENTIEITFSVPDIDFSFKAGQYVSICIPSLSVAGVPDRCHDFSIASSPKSLSEISIAFRASTSIFKTALLSMPIGGVVNIDGPKGVLTLPEPPATNLIFVAGGIGITPLISMIRFATETSSPQQITLLYCNTKEETTAYVEELQELQKQNRHLSVNMFFGIPEESFFAPYAEESLRQRRESADSDALWYIVGAPAMVKSVQQILRESGILDNKILTEEFSGYDKQ